MDLLASASWIYAAWQQMINRDLMISKASSPCSAIMSAQTWGRGKQPTEINRNQIQLVLKGQCKSFVFYLFRHLLLDIAIAECLSIYLSQEISSCSDKKIDLASANERAGGRSPLCEPAALVWESKARGQIRMAPDHGPKLAAPVRPSAGLSQGGGHPPVAVQLEDGRRAKVSISHAIKPRVNRPCSNHLMQGSDSSRAQTLPGLVLSCWASGDGT